MATIGNLVINIVGRTEQLEKSSIAARVAIGAVKSAAIGGAFALTRYALGFNSNAAMMQAGVRPVANLTRAVSQNAATWQVLGTATSTVAPIFLRSAASMAVMSGGLAAVTAGAVAAGVAMQQLISLLREGVGLFARYEQLSVALQTMTGSPQTANKLLSDLNRFAAETPFDTSDVQTAGRNLLAFGIEAEHVLPNLKMLGDVASGVGMSLDELATIFAKNAAQGKIYTIDIQQLAARGIPIWDAMAKQFGVTQGEMRKMVEDGKVQAGHYQQALYDISRTRFADMMQKQSVTLSGLFSTFRSDIADTKRSLGETFVNTAGFKGFVQGMDDLAKSTKTVAETLAKISELAGKFSPLPGVSMDNFVRGAIRGAIRSMLPEKFLLAMDLLNAADKLTGGKLSESDDWKIAILNQEEDAKAFKKALGQQRNRAFWGTLEDMASRGSRLFTEMQTPQERYNATLAELSSLLGVGAINFQTYGRAVAAAKSELTRAMDEPSPALKAFLDQGERFRSKLITPTQEFRQNLVDVSKQLIAGNISLNEFTMLAAKLSGEQKKFLAGRDPDGAAERFRTFLNLGGQIRSKLITPMQEYKQAIADASQAFIAGQINFAELGMIVAKVQGDFDRENKKKKSTLVGDQFARAAEKGTRDEFNQVVRSIVPAREDQHMENLVQIAQNQLRETKDLVKAVRDGDSVVEFA